MRKVAPYQIQNISVNDGEKYGGFVRAVFSGDLFV